MLTPECRMTDKRSLEMRGPPVEWKLEAPHALRSWPSWRPLPLGEKSSCSLWTGRQQVLHRSAQPCPCAGGRWRTLTAKSRDWVHTPACPFQANDCTLCLSTSLLFLYKTGNGTAYLQGILEGINRSLWSAKHHAWQTGTQFNKQYPLL